jgi:hypothetical protein
MIATASRRDSAWPSRVGKSVGSQMAMRFWDTQLGFYGRRFELVPATIAAQDASKLSYPIWSVEAL